MAALQNKPQEGRPSPEKKQDPLGVGSCLSQSGAWAGRPRGADSTMGIRLYEDRTGFIAKGAIKLKKKLGSRESMQFPSKS